MKNLVTLYEQMLTIRLLEERLQGLCDRGLAGDLHFNKGQEAIAVGVCAALRPEDRIVTHHRTIAHQVAKGAKLYPLVAELLGKRTGINGGRAGEMHISDHDIGHNFSFQLVGTCIPVAAGLAWALKYHRKVDEIVAVFFGDAASSNGQFHEGLSLAAIHKLPMLFICENNGLAGNIKPKHYLPSKNVLDRAAYFGFKCFSIDGNDVGTVMDTTREAMRLIKLGETVFIECHTERLCWHKQGQRDVRSVEELAALARKEPIERAEKLLGLRFGVSVDKNAMAKKINEHLDEVFARAESDLPPEVYID